MDGLDLLRRVYPRVYGGTPNGAGPSTLEGGLSPRVRGNPLSWSGVAVCVGSIPACTGEPVLDTDVRLIRWVYPRVYGGTRVYNGTREPKQGLSPRVRGNQHGAISGTRISRSIPACTGEPLDRTKRRDRTGVYPRVYGGTVVLAMMLVIGQGLSPRVRGNRADGPPMEVHPRSIPACTGEPK